MLAVVLYKEAVFRAMSDYILLPAFAVLFIWLVVKIVKTVREMHKYNRDKKERGENPRWRIGK